MLKRGFWKDHTGLAAVEFAFVAPVLITLFFGTVELSRGLSARGDVVEMASSAADLIAQESATTPDDITNVYNAASTVLYPYYDKTKASTQAPSIRISSIVDNNTATSGKVAWTCSWTGSGTFPTAVTNAGTVTIPKGLITPGGGGSIIMAEVLYKYKSPTTQIVSPSGVTMSNVFYLRPRRVDQVTGPTSSTCPSAPS